MARRVGRPKKEGDPRLGKKVRDLRVARERHKARMWAEVKQKDVGIAKALKEFQASGAGLTAMCEAYGTKDRRTILELLRLLDEEN